MGVRGLRASRSFGASRPRWRRLSSRSKIERGISRRWRGLVVAGHHFFPFFAGLDSAALRTLAAIVRSFTLSRFVAGVKRLTPSSRR